MKDDSLEPVIEGYEGLEPKTNGYEGIEFGILFFVTFMPIVDNL